MYVDITAGSVTCNEDEDPEIKMSSLFHELAEEFVSSAEEFEEDDKSFIKAVVCGWLLMVLKYLESI